MSDRLAGQQQAITVRVKYLSAVRDRTGRQGDEIRLHPRAMLNEVAAWLWEQHGLAAPGPQIMAVLNGVGWPQLPAGLGTSLADGDEIVLFPPIGGG